MATNRLWGVVFFLAASASYGREAASPSACQAASTQPAIASARNSVKENPDDVKANFRLADAWSDAGCFNEAVQVLQNIQANDPDNKELQTRLRVARSLVGEEHFFDNLDRADADARLKRNSFRCSSLADLDACSAAVRDRPDDPTVLVADGDALMKANRPADAVAVYRLAATRAGSPHDVVVKINAAEALMATEPTIPLSAQRGRAATSTTASAPAQAKTPAQATASLRAPVKQARPRLARNQPQEPTVKHFSNAAPEAQSH